MPAAIIDWKAIAEAVKADVRHRAGLLRSQRGVVPGLAFILVGENPASQSYVRSKGNACDELGFHSVPHTLPASTTQDELLALIAQCQGKKGRKGKGGYGPADGTGNQGVGPRDGSGYGPGAGSGNCTGTGPKGQGRGRRGGRS